MITDAIRQKSRTTSKDELEKIVSGNDSYVHPVARFCKRAIDISLSLFFLLLFLPVFPLIAIAVKLNDRGPVFFSQMRVGRMWPTHTEIFWMIKFRSMYTDAESRSGPVWATKHDPRITPVGRFLRKTRLDEIPQFVNVLKGEMSLIGPRPERPGFYNKLEEAIPFFAERTYGVTPGITGLAQVNQGYDESIEDVRSKLAYDHAYAMALSSPKTWFLIDFEIVFKTFWVMVTGRGQ